ncbi:MAG TPA: YdeI/OmpD-associated family protein [Gemmatimonadaceae bacterium]|jgi:uncharacterized protein YdeI (YjbR/CyaY-like superfamily)
MTELELSAIFFASPDDFRTWLMQHHEAAHELWVGFHKKHTGRPTLTWPESVDEALCFGWIDGVRKSVGREAYVIRFTPRKPRSIWSNVNIRKAKALVASGRMHPAGMRAFEARDSKKSGIYSFEQRKRARLAPSEEKQFRASKKAWAFFQSQPPGYQQLATWWVISAKRSETRAKRLATLVSDSAAGLRIRELRLTRAAE